MTYREVFTKFRDDLSKLDPNEPTVVVYDAKSHLLQYTQLNRSFLVGYLSPFFFPKKNFKVGVLTQSGLNKLMYELQKLLSNNLLDDGQYIPDIVELGTNWYRCYSSGGLVTPMKTISLNYCNVTSKFYTWYLCRNYNDSTRTLYRLVTNKKG